jgi:hypothetical protein
MKVRKRGTDSKRHTVSYLIGNRWVTRSKAVSLAKDGKVDGVYVCKGKKGSYIQSLPGRTKLYDLPIAVRG